MMIAATCGHVGGDQPSLGLSVAYKPKSPAHQERRRPAKIVKALCQARQRHLGRASPGLRGATLTSNPRILYIYHII